MPSSTQRVAWTIAGRVLLAILVIWSAGSLLVSASFLWTPRGTTGISSDYGGDITGVDPGSPADRARVAAGDRIILSKTTFDSRPKLIGNVTPVAPGTVIRFRLAHGSAERDVVLKAALAHPGLAGRVSLLLSTISAAIFIIVGAALILLRPSLVTWGFGLFGLLSNPVVPALSQFPSAQAHLAYVTLYDILQNVGVVGLLVFALNFPRTLPLHWRRALVKLLPAIFILLAAWTLWIDLAVCVFAVPVHPVNVALQIAFGAIDILAILLITETYVKGPSENRPRLRWVLVGFYVGLVCNFIGNLLVYTANVTLPAWLDATLIAMSVTLPLTVSYAIVRHRVIDIDLFVSRALVYASFTTLLIVIFGFTDWIFSQVLSDFRLSIVLDAGISVGLAFVFDRAHAMMERGIARFVFRARRLAWDRIERTAKTFRFTDDPSTIDAALVRDPHEALDVAAVALFRPAGNAFYRAESVGWTEQQCASLDRNDRLVLEHLAQDGPLHLGEIPWLREDLPQKAGYPMISFPLRSANELSGLLLCSRKRNGEDLDPEEMRTISDLTDAAAVAYARLDSQELRKKAADLEEQVHILNARLDEARKPAGPRTSLA